MKRNPKRPTSRHIIIKMAKFQDKERISKAARKKQEGTHKEAQIRLPELLNGNSSNQKKMAKYNPSN